MGKEEKKDLEESGKENSISNTKILQKEGSGKSIAEFGRGFRKSLSGRRVFNPPGELSEPGCLGFGSV